MALRLRRRMSVILNADETVAKVDASLDRFNETLTEFAEVLDRFAATLDDFGHVVRKVDAVGDDLEVITNRLGPLTSGLELAGPALRIPDQVRRLGGRLPGRGTAPGPDTSARSSESDETAP